MQLERFTIKSQEALQAAQRLADERGHPQTTPEHLLAVLLEQDAGVVVPLLRKVGRRPGGGSSRPRVLAGGTRNTTNIAGKLCLDMLA